VQGVGHGLLPWESSLTISIHPIQDLYGNLISPSRISNDGTYHDGVITWVDLPPVRANERETLSVFYEWSHPVQIENITATFSGRNSIRFLPFRDVTQDDWFYFYVFAVTHNGWIIGTSETTFSPHEPLTRAAVATIFHRMAGERAVSFQPIFDDVVADRWYSPAVTWAYREGIVMGMGDGRFAPDDLITREQLATMMLRSAPLWSLQDAVIPEHAVVPEFAASPWAYEAMRVVMFFELMTAESPTPAASRAETVAFIVRFIDEFFAG